MRPQPALPSFTTFGDHPDLSGNAAWKVEGGMMREGDASVSQMLATYRDLIRRFVIGEISADEFETDYLARFKDDPNQVTGEEFNILDGLFADVDDYVGDPILRESTAGISGEELRARARDAYTRLFDALD